MMTNPDQQSKDTDALEDKIGVSYSEGDKDKAEHPLRFMDRYFPDTDDMKLKGRLKQALTVRFSSVTAIFEFYPEVKELEPLVRQWCNDIEKRLVSVDGKSRDEYREILIALLHGYKLEENTADGETSFFKSIFDANPDRSDKND